ncbi:N-acetylmuramoyl-L-alanine amidase [Amaricoccus sp. W119]|uniref:N-acetylmuramoyl-L-alanine amidase n=1 Tax=Amaricoccus sp. W119 TaxID=3391833 RepID=UPI0039A4B615
MECAEAALHRLCDPAAEVSAHYVVGGRGELWQLVPEEARAWHAGTGAWGAVHDVNSRSIGIELVNPGPLDGLPPYPEPQMVALERLLDDIMARWNIPPARVIGHSDMAPGRKADPGPKFDWSRLARGGRAIFVGERGLGPATADWEVFARACGVMGYHAADVGGWPVVLGAFRLRFRPWASGPLSATDVALALEIARRHPCVDAPALPT